MSKNTKRTAVIAAFMAMAFAALPFLLSRSSVPGYDSLGMAMYCDVMRKAPPLPAVSTVLDTFGDPLPCVEKLITEWKPTLIQIDLIDATCWRNGVCPKGAPRPDDIGAIKQRAARVAAVAARSPPTIDWYVSPALEHDVRDPKKVRAMLEAVKAGCPVCKPINSPFSGAKIPEYPIELHGTKVRAFSVSGDGASIFDGDNLSSDRNGFEHNVSGARSTFAWWNELNLRCTGEKKFTPPLKRTEKPTLDQFRQAWLNMQPEPSMPSAPPICKTVFDIAKPEIYKPNSESYCNGQGNENDERSNRPLLLIKRAGKTNEQLSIIRPDGKPVGCFRYYGKYSDGVLHRWYVGNCSGQNPAQLYDDLGGEWGFITLGGGKCYRFNAVRRQGVYR